MGDFLPKIKLNQFLICLILRLLALSVFVRLLTLAHAMLPTDFLSASHEYWKLVREFW